MKPRGNGCNKTRNNYADDGGAHPIAEKNLDASSQCICVACKAKPPATTPSIAKKRNRTETGPQTANQRAVLSAYLRPGGIKMQTQKAADPNTRKKNTINAANRKIMPPFFPGISIQSNRGHGPMGKFKRKMARPHLY